MRLRDLPAYLAPTLLLAASLTACTAPRATMPTAPTVGVVTSPPAVTTVSIVTPPASAPTVANVAPTLALPTLAPAEPLPAVAPRPGLVGPEWTPLASGDPYGDGVETVIAYQPVPAGTISPPRSIMGYPALAAEAVIVRRGPDGQPQVAARITTGAVFLNDALYPIAPENGLGPRAAALLLDASQPGAPLRAIPVGADGEALSSGIALTWNAVNGAVDVQLLGAAPAEEWPGPGWDVAHEGDFNGDGFVERVYYRPSSLAVNPAMREGEYANTYVAEEVIIAQVEPDRTYALAQIDLTSVRGKRVLATLTSPGQGPENSPAAFLLATPSNEQTPVAVVPLNASGNGYTQGFGLRWDPAAGDYRLSGGIFGDS